MYTCMCVCCVRWELNEVPSRSDMWAVCFALCSLTAGCFPVIYHRAVCCAGVSGFTLTFIFPDERYVKVANKKIIGGRCETKPHFAKRTKLFLEFLRAYTGLCHNVVCVLCATRSRTASWFYLSNTSISLRGKQIACWPATDFIRSSELMIHVARRSSSPGNLCWSACWQRRGPQPSLSDWSLQMLLFKYSESDP